MLLSLGLPSGACVYLQRQWPEGLGDGIRLWEQGERGRKASSWGAKNASPNFSYDVWWVGEGDICIASFGPHHCFDSCMTLAKTLPSLGLSFFICGMG